MRYVWDLEKSDQTRRLRNFDFDHATLVFKGRTLMREDTRRNYGERRFMAVGLVEGVCLTVVFTDRETEGVLTRRIISARRSSKNERRLYEEADSARED